MTNNNLKVCTWNVCLGLKYKLNYIRELLVKNSIDILCIQEAEVAADDEKRILEIPNYSLELERVTGSNVIRTVMYIKSTISYVRHEDEESPNTHIILISCHGLGIASLYRTYKLTEHTNHQNAFSEQLGVLSTFFAQQRNYITLGDFNLDENKRNDNSYHHAHLYMKWKEFEDEQQLLQLVNFNTWCRQI
jgi:exonuclease III